jgi:hypothetical protein
MDMVTLQLAQAKLDEQATANHPPALHVVRG